MDLIKKNFGFGCMRLPVKDGEVDTVGNLRSDVGMFHEAVCSCE